MQHLNNLGIRTSITLTAAAVIVSGGIVGGLLLANGASATSRPSAAAQATISVTGTGKTTGTPDTLTVLMGVSTSALSATRALDENDTEMSRLEVVLIGGGVSKDDLQTSNLEVSPNYDSDGTITSYETDDDLTITFRDVAKSGSVIDAAAYAVGNAVQIESISFSISNTSALVKSARLQAIHDAETEASDLATGAGTSLGPVMKISDQEQQTTPPPVAFNASADTGATRSAVPLQPGSEQVSVQVEVVYELKS